MWQSFPLYLYLKDRAKGVCLGLAWLELSPLPNPPHTLLSLSVLFSTCVRPADIWKVKVISCEITHRNFAEDACYYLWAKSNIYPPNRCTGLVHSFEFKPGDKYVLLYPSVSLISYETPKCHWQWLCSAWKWDQQGLQWPLSTLEWEKGGKRWQLMTEPSAL